MKSRETQLTISTLHKENGGTGRGSGWHWLTPKMRSGGAPLGGGGGGSMGGPGAFGAGGRTGFEANKRSALRAFSCLESATSAIFEASCTLPIAKSQASLPPALATPVAVRLSG